MASRVFALILAFVALVSCKKTPTSTSYVCQCYFTNNVGVAKHEYYSLEHSSKESAKSACHIKDSLIKSWYGHTTSACYLN